VLDKQTFKVVVRSAPLVSIDLIVKNNNMFLLGKRVNNPAKDYLFSVGGRVYKNEKINDAIMRIADSELGVSLKSTPKFIGVFEHFYDNSIYENVSTHYVNLAYEMETEELLRLPTEQHNEYQWLTLEELLKSKLVHKYVKDYFKY
tara:strand:+ start:93 stop:530 length:438 start_codon:yes stop_codon:yes gene_type:complete